MENVKEKAAQIIERWTEHINITEEQASTLNERYNAQKELKKLEKIIFSDKNLIIEICKQSEDLFLMYDIRLIEFCSKKIFDDYSTVLEIIKTNGFNLEHLKDEFKDDKKMVLEAIKGTNALQYASERLRDDYDIVKLALENDPESFKFTSDRFKNDKELILGLAKKSYYILKDVSIELRKDPQFLLDFWYEVKNKYKNSHVNMLTFTGFTMACIDESLLPFFNGIELNENISKQIESTFNNIILNQQLNIGLAKKDKKLKV